MGHQHPLGRFLDPLQARDRDVLRVHDGLCPKNRLHDGLEFRDPKTVHLQVRDEKRSARSSGTLINVDFLHLVEVGSRAGRRIEIMVSHVDDDVFGNPFFFRPHLVPF